MEMPVEQLASQLAEMLGRFRVQAKADINYKEVEGELFRIVSVKAKDTKGDQVTLMKETIPCNESKTELKARLEEQKAQAQATLQSTVTTFDEKIAQLDNPV